MKVSIIIPTKNRWSLLKETLNNILQQSLPAYEIIVVDDGSTDGTIENLKIEYKDQVIAVLNKGRGPGAARNTGLEIATGNYIKFFDSDDLMTKNTLEVQVQILQESKNSFVYSSYFQAKSLEGKWIPANNTILHFYPFPVSQPLYYWMCRGLFLPIPSMLFGAELLLEVGKWREDVTAYEDFDYLWRLSLLVPLPLHTNKCAFLYRTHGKQITEHDFTHEQRDKDKILVFERILDEYFPQQLNSYDFKNLYMKIAFLQDSFSRRFNEFNLLIMKRIIQFNEKRGRIKSNCEWQHFAGPFLNKQKLEEYMNTIS